MNKKQYTIGDGTKVYAPPMVEASSLTFFDELEQGCWDLFKQYCRQFGVEITDKDAEDFCIAKGIQEKVLEIFEENGIHFNYNNDVRERKFMHLTSEIESKKAELLKNDYSQTNASTYDTLTEIGRLTAERDRIYGDDTTEVCFVLSDNECYNEVVGFLGDDTGFCDINGTPLHIGDTIHFQSGVSEGYNRLVLNRLVTKDVVNSFDAVKVTDADDYDLNNTFNAGFTIEVTDCKQKYLESVESQGENEGMEMSL